jgi:hypothetical protein
MILMTIRQADEECHPQASGHGSCPSEAHSGGWEGLGEDGQEPMLRGMSGFSSLGKIRVLTIQLV